MGARGPKRTPSDRLKLTDTDNWRVKEREKRGEPQPPKIGSTDPPEWLDPKSHVWWHRIVSELSRVPGLLRSVDHFSLATFADTLREYEDACEIIKREGMVYTNGKGEPTMHPAKRVRDAAWTQLQAHFRDFGMTPADRASIELEPHDGKGESDRNIYFNSTG